MWACSTEPESPINRSLQPSPALVRPVLARKSSGCSHHVTPYPLPACMVSGTFKLRPVKSRDFEFSAAQGRFMFRKVYAARFEKAAANGRNRACFLTCVDLAGNRTEAVVKFSAMSESGHGTLIREALAAFFAADLGLPVPEPLLIEVPEAFVNVMATTEHGPLIAQSSRYAFGSEKLGAGYQIFAPAFRLTDGQLQCAAEIFAFDTFVANSDRAPHNPNCLFHGDYISIIDHDLSFLMGTILFWKAPWELGGADELSRVDKHIFWVQVKQKNLSFERLKLALLDISDERLAEYVAALPADWMLGNNIAEEIVSYIKRLRENAHDAFAEVERVLQ